jgi:hypothetical protein
LEAIRLLGRLRGLRRLRAEGPGRVSGEVVWRCYGEGVAEVATASKSLVRIDVQLRCEQGQAEQLIGEADHVEYGDGIARVHATTVSTDHLTSEAASAVERIEGWLGIAGLSYDDVLRVDIGTEALIEDNGVWRRRGEAVLS